MLRDFSAGTNSKSPLSLVTLGTVVNTTTCSGAEGSIEIVGLENFKVYEVSYNIDGTGATVTTNSE